jgi:hypothetical protein
MEFFNKKEEVIDLKLTQYGRYLLSKGGFKPTYYSFHDDNVLYNSEKAGVTELQNDSETRIVETPTLHHQISISSLEKEFNNNYNKIISGQANASSQDVQRTAEKSYMLTNFLGTSDINSEYAPSWTVQFLNGTLSGSSKSLDLLEKTGGNNLQILPQLDSTMTIEVNSVDADSDNPLLDEAEDSALISNVNILSSDDDLYVLLKISENNGMFQKENFDIEIFEIEEEIQSGTTIETLRQLEFSKNSLPAAEMEFVEDALPEEDVTHVEYYFDLLTDNEINNEILCKFDPVNQKKGVYADARTKLCQDVINEQKRKVFDIYTDESDNPGDIC